MKDARKQCSRCKKWKLLHEFGKRSKADAARRHTEAAKRSAVCKTCRAEYRRVRLWWTTVASRLRPLTTKAVREHLREPATCYLCGDPLNRQTCSVDHIEPGAGNVLSNLAWAHHRCNGMKQDLTPAEFIRQAEKMIRHLRGGTHLGCCTTKRGGSDV